MKHLLYFVVIISLCFFISLLRLTTKGNITIYLLIIPIFWIILTLSFIHSAHTHCTHQTSYLCLRIFRSLHISKTLFLCFSIFINIPIFLFCLSCYIVFFHSSFAFTLFLTLSLHLFPSSSSSSSSCGNFKFIYLILQLNLRNCM